MVEKMSSRTQSIVLRYNHLYRQLYNRDPRGLRVLNSKFVIVNETKIRIEDLEQLNTQLEAEYNARQQEKRSTIMRLIGWLRNT
ncbi:MAG: hypothetical protein AAF787_07270 [Chloroflexota bacterium]